MSKSEEMVETSRPAQGLERAVLDVDSIIQEACERTSLDDLGPDDYLPAMRALVTSLDQEAGLTLPGRMAVRESLVKGVINRLYLAHNARHYPVIGEIPIEKPIFIIGLLRTGSTLLHNLLAQHPGIRAPLLWELGTPASPSADPEHELQIMRGTQDYVDEYFQVAPQLKSIHYLSALWPDECHRLLGNAFASRVFEMRYDVPSYACWLAEQDLVSAFRYHRHQLQHILWRKPGSHVLLKDPFHIWTLDALLGVYPDARLVHLHRDPVKVIPSTCSLSAVIRAARAESVDLPAIGRKWHGAVEVAIERTLRFHERADERVCNVLYRDLVRDPIATLGRVCEHVGVPFSRTAQIAAERWLAVNPQHKHGRHQYDAAQFGLDPQVLRKQFTAYYQAYDLDPERGS